ncbi:unnamed protein product [Rhodiola kirilowii]
MQRGDYIFAGSTLIKNIRDARCSEIIEDWWEEDCD